MHLWRGTPPPGERFPSSRRVHEFGVDGCGGKINAPGWREFPPAVRNFNPIPSMKLLRKTLTSIFALLAVALGIAVTGCASMESHQKESLLSASGFRSRTPATPKQISIFQSLPPYKMQRRTVNGKVLYAYADPKRDFLYVGTQAEYDAYKKLQATQNIAEEQEMTAAMNQQDELDWNAWGPYGLWY